VNSMSELAPRDDEVKNLLERHVKRNEALLAEYVAKRQEFRIDFDARELAIVANVMITGMAAETLRLDGARVTRRASQTVFFTP